MATSRYKINFTANFDYVIFADDDAEAQLIAGKMEKSPGIALSVAENMQCACNFITRSEKDAAE